MGDATTTWSEMVAAHTNWAQLHPDTGDLPVHSPTAAVLACSDARVPPSLIFGQPAGNLFVVRLAGNSATAGAVASLTYATETLGTPLVIVLGHTGCGAVTSALSPAAAPELKPILQPIDDMLEGCLACDTDLDAAVTANVSHNLRRLARDRGPLGESIRAGRVTLRGAVHDLRTGALIEVDASSGAMQPSTARSTS